MTGPAAIVDEFLSNPHTLYHHTYRTKNIKFHDPTNEDPDWKTKQCILALVAAASKLENGMNCWLAAKVQAESTTQTLVSLFQKTRWNVSFLVPHSYGQTRSGGSSLDVMLTGMHSCRQSKNGISGAQNCVFRGCSSLMSQ
jgi:hypothetical protein